MEGTFLVDEVEIDVVAVVEVVVEYAVAEELVDVWLAVDIF